MLDLGCGEDKTPGTVGFDARPLPGVDVVGDALHLPFRDVSVAAVFCHHVLEHFTKRDGLALLREVHRVLSPGGVLMVAVPDMEAMAHTYLRYIREGNWKELENLTANYYGGFGLREDYLMNRHQWGYSRHPLAEALRSVGFSVRDAGRRDMHECMLEGTK